MGALMRAKSWPDTLPGLPEMSPETLKMAVSICRLGTWTAIFLTTTILTSITGFGFPFHQLLGSHVVRALSLAVLRLAVVALYGRRFTGAWRRVHVVNVVVALYFQRVRADRASILESAGAARSRADPAGAAFRSNSINRPGQLPRRRSGQRQEIREGGDPREPSDVPIT